MPLRFIACARNENKGEQVTRNYLMNHLAHTDGVLLGNYHLPMNTSTLECDFVLFSQRGVWILEVKNWHGRIMIDPVNWQRNDGHIEHSPLISVEAKARILARVLRNKGYENLSVVGLVVLSQLTAELDNTDGGIKRELQEDRIFRLDARLIQALTGRQYLHKPTNRDLGTKEIKRIVHGLVPRAIDPEHKRIVDNYQIEYDLGYGPDRIFHTYQAVHLTIPGRYARAKKYSTSTVTDTGKLESTGERFKRDMQALALMEQKPNIVQMYDYQTDRDGDDTHWLLLEWIKGITLQVRLDIGPAIPAQEQRHILNAIVDALVCCHSNNILHRNLSPDCVYLAEDGTIKLGDFDFARIPNLTSTITITGEPLLTKVNRYMASELQNDARSADHRSDLYALGAIWYDMVIRPQPNEDINLALLQECELSGDARDLLIRLLDPMPERRPQNAMAVKRWLAQV